MPYVTNQHVEQVFLAMGIKTLPWDKERGIAMIIIGSMSAWLRGQQPVTWRWLMRCYVCSFHSRQLCKLQPVWSLQALAWLQVRAHSVIRRLVSSCSVRSSR